MPELCFFVGKGGVGKTTISAAYGTYRALARPAGKVLLISTDPAHSLADVLQLRLGDRPTPVALARRRKLYVWQINAEKEFSAFLRKNREALLRTIESGSIFSRDEIEPLLDTSLPGIAEVSGLLAINDALHAGKYDSVVLDTAPFGHTLRLFGLPQQFARLLDFLELAGSRDRILAEHFGATQATAPEKFLADWRSLVTQLQQAIGREAQVFLVTTPEDFALQESLRVTAALRDLFPQLGITATVLNRAIVRRGNCATCQKKASASKTAMSAIQKSYPGATTYVAEDCGAPILGVANLASFGGHIFGKKRLSLKLATPTAVDLQLRAAQWPVMEAPLAFVVGKGGVGKTTVSAALGFRTRMRKRHAVTICSVDPAPSLDDIFQQQIADQPSAVLGDSKFRAMEMDAASAFTRWVNEIKDRIDAALTSDVAGVHVDLSFERRLLSALLDIVPPGVDEVFAVFRILDLLGDRSQRVIIDMAPTGHALELLRTPERMLLWSKLMLKTLAAHRRLALARDIAVEIVQFGQRVRELLTFLHDRERTWVWTVMLAEPLPDDETARLLNKVRELKLPVGPLIVNRVIFSNDSKGCARCNRTRQWQLATIARLKGRYRERDIYIARNFPVEIAGKQQLRKFTSELWRLA